MTTRILQRQSLTDKETSNGIEVSEESPKELEFTNDNGANDRRSVSERTQVSLFCSIVLFTYVFYIFFLAVFIVASTVFIEKEDTRSGPMPTNDTNT